ncbi:MAG TPA: hypothetical protein VMB78_07985 [Dissulfurispiraceae bacterium]|nr:hypothetical protein [Dissulfurispiraceae bacterium]
MRDISGRRCGNHPTREAVALCTGCGRSFCRECITEHDDKMFCASCLEKFRQTSSSRSFNLRDLFTAGTALAGVFITWLAFYYFARILISIPTPFHDGTIWQAGIR